METASRQRPDVSRLEPSRALVGGASILAVLSASCCVLPVGLTLLGLGGAWLTILGPFVAYRHVILIVIGGVLAWSWFSLWRSSCGGRRYAINLALVAVATLIYLAALSAPLWEFQVTRDMLNHFGAPR